MNKLKTVSLMTLLACLSACELPPKERNSGDASIVELSLGSFHPRYTIFFPAVQFGQAKVFEVGDPPAAKDYSVVLILKALPGQMTSREQLQAFCHQLELNQVKVRIRVVAGGKVQLEYEGLLQPDWDAVLAISDQALLYPPEDFRFELSGKSTVELELTPSGAVASELKVIIKLGGGGLPK